ncbi:MAG: hypothetical protein GY940_06090, partial [bacterium]|nr:hypothetical protein [bacterium]
GETVCYTMTGFQFDDSDNNLKWDAFRFYTPEGDITDEEGHRYFDVPADEIPIERDDTLNKHMMIIVTKNDGAEVVEVMEGAEFEGVSIGLEGDIVANGFIPAAPGEEIVFNYMEVTNG